jgi:hypothetical protein
MNDLTSLIIQTIKALLPDATIYRENMDQGAFVEPSFFVSRVSMTAAPGIGSTGYSERNYGYDVAYFPDPDNRPNEDLDAKAEWLAENLRTINDADGNAYAYAINREFNVTDQVLHYTYNVQLFVAEASGATFNQGLDIQGELLDGN